jgi:hypothetical protein
MWRNIDDEPIPAYIPCVWVKDSIGNVYWMTEREIIEVLPLPKPEPRKMKVIDWLDFKGTWFEVNGKKMYWGTYSLIKGSSTGEEGIEITKTLLESEGVEVL